MRPYFDQDGIVIYHGDCRDALASLVDIPALVLTDPPYGMDYRPVRSAPGSQTKWMREQGIDSVVGDDEPFDPAPLLRFPRLVKDGFAASHAELAWTNLCSSVRKFSLQWGGEARNREPHLHPTQKPVGLMRWIVEMFTEPGDMVLDPYMGSGPVAQACRETGRGYLGFEIEERYCEAAVRRFAQGAFDFGEAA